MNLYRFFLFLVGLEVEEFIVYLRMIQVVVQQIDICLIIIFIVLGERYLSDQLVLVIRIFFFDFFLGYVSRVLCRGIVQNLYSMFSFQQFKEWGVERVIGRGSALFRNEVLKQEVQRVFFFLVFFGQDVDVVVGVVFVMFQRNFNQKEFQLVQFLVKGLL